MDGSFGVESGNPTLPKDHLCGYLTSSAESVRSIDFEKSRNVHERIETILLAKKSLEDIKKDFENLMYDLGRDHSYILIPVFLEFPYEKHIEVGTAILFNFFMEELLKNLNTDDAIKSICDYIETREKLLTKHETRKQYIYVVERYTHDIIREFSKREDFQVVMESLIKKKKGIFPYLFLRSFYDIYPSRAFRYYTDVLVSDKRGKQALLEQGKIIEEALAKLEVHYISGDLIGQNVNDTIKMFSERNEWWMRFYVVTIMNKYDELRNHSILSKLEEDENPFVREELKSFQR
jgi:hypothetical protein